MSAAEVIEQIKKLQPEELDKVWSFMEQSAPKPEPVVSDEFKAIASKVFSQNEELFRKLAQ